MAKPGRRSAIRGGTSSKATHDRLIDAAFETLREEGFARASARAIAARGGVNAALIFYHFGSVNDLLVEALGRSSAAQLAKYRQALAEVTTPAELVAAVRGQLVDDIASGHVKVMVDLIGASSSDEDLRTAVFEHVQPWMDFAGETMEQVLAPRGLAGVVPMEQVSFMVVSAFLGMELLTEAAGSGEIVAGLLDTVQNLTSVLDSLVPAGVPR